jgi:hypothetical protein
MQSKQQKKGATCAVARKNLIKERIHQNEKLFEYYMSFGVIVQP